MKDLVRAHALPLLYVSIFRPSSAAVGCHKAGTHHRARTATSMNPRWPVLQTMVAVAKRCCYHAPWSWNRRGEVLQPKHGRAATSAQQCWDRRVALLPVRGGDAHGQVDCYNRGCQRLRPATTLATHADATPIFARRMLLLCLFLFLI